MGKEDEKGALLGTNYACKTLEVKVRRRCTRLGKPGLIKRLRSVNSDGKDPLKGKNAQEKAFATEEGAKQLSDWNKNLIRKVRRINDERRVELLSQRRKDMISRGMRSCGRLADRDDSQITKPTMPTTAKPSELSNPFAVTPTCEQSQNNEHTNRDTSLDINLVNRDCAAD